jgi:dTDP-4-dehydrorhamnose 3,5-epimerase
MDAVQAARPRECAIKKIPTSLPGVFMLEPRVFGDERGFFFESYNQQRHGGSRNRKLCAG